MSQLVPDPSAVADFVVRMTRRTWPSGAAGRDRYFAELGLVDAGPAGAPMNHGYPQRQKRPKCDSERRSILHGGIMPRASAHAAVRLRHSTRRPPLGLRTGPGTGRLTLCGPRAGGDHEAR